MNKLGSNFSLCSWVLKWGWSSNVIFIWQVDDQMKLLQHSWSDMLVLDHLHQRLHNNLPDETTLHNGQKFDLLCLGLLGVPSLADLFNDLSSKLQELKFDLSDYICMKFLMLLNHGEIFLRLYFLYFLKVVKRELFWYQHLVISVQFQNYWNSKFNEIEFYVLKYLLGR